MTTQQFLKRRFFKRVAFLAFLMSSVGAIAQKKSIGSVSDFKASLQPQQLTNGNVMVNKLLKTTRKDITVSISTFKSENGEDVWSGSVSKSKSSNVYLKFSKGKVEGTVVDPKTEKAYTYSTDASGNVIVAEENIHRVLCTNYEESSTANTERAASAQAAPPAGSVAYTLQSLPGATGVIYLDFDGQVVTSPRWNSGNTINAAPANVTESDITTIWKHISEDYAPYNVNVTTSEAVFLAAPLGKRIRNIYTPTSSWYGSAGGVAYINSFAWTDDTPCWSFYYSTKTGSEVGSHEIGHTMGLSHDGRTTPAESYYGGQGNWAPIMGVSYYKPFTQWSKGEYQYANQTQDDVTIISTKVPYKADEAGDAKETAKTLALNSSGTVLASNNGIITTRTDVDGYSFTTSGGNVSLTVSPAAVSPNLDIFLSLKNSSGTLVATANPTTLYSASISTTLTAGTYYLYIDGTGLDDPFTTGYSDYASIGQYTISGTVPVSTVNQPPIVSITSPSNGATFTAPASVTINASASDADGTISNVEFYNGTTLLGSDNTSPYSYSWTGVAAGTYSVTAKAYDNTSAITTSSVVSITVNTAANQLPAVSITFPANGATFTAPASVTINATASDADGTISKVEFYNGTTLLGSDNTSPYSYNWTNVAAGTYSVTAKAYDNLNANKTSTVVSVTVNNPSGTCTAPLWNSSTAYWAGDVVQYSGIKYKANWWTQNNRPDLNNGGEGSGQPWLSLGTCTSRMSAEEEILTHAAFSVFPNPASGYLNIRINGEVEHIEIIGTDGILYLSENNTPGIDISSLSSGLYIAKIQVNGTTFIKKFSKE